MIVGIDHRQRASEVRRDHHTHGRLPEVPGLGVVAVRRKGRVVDEIGELRAAGGRPMRPQVGRHCVIIRTARQPVNSCASSRRDAGTDEEGSPLHDDHPCEKVPWLVQHGRLAGIRC
jgi:hypothetical protein